MSRSSHGVDGALGAASHFEKTPAGGAVHVFLRQSRKARELLQRQFGGTDDAVVIVNLLRKAFRHLGNDLPGIRRKPLA